MPPVLQTPAPATRGKSLGKILIGAALIAAVVAFAGNAKGNGKKTRNSSPQTRPPKIHRKASSSDWRANPDLYTAPLHGGYYKAESTYDRRAQEYGRARAREGKPLSVAVMTIRGFSKRQRILAEDAAAKQVDFPFYPTSF